MRGFSQRKAERTNSIPQSIGIDRADSWDFDLSRNKSLRTLETTAEAIASVDASPSFLKTALFTIASSLPIDVVVIYRECEVDCMVRSWTKPVSVEYGVGYGRATNIANHRKRFKAFRQMYKEREFRLVLCADVLDCVADYAVGVLDSVVKAERAKGRLDYLLCEPLIISEIRSPRTRLTDPPVGWTGRWGMVGSAL